MKKRFLGILGVAALGALSLASCAKDEDVFHIYAWNQEFQGFFNKYVSDEKTADAKVYHLNGKKVKSTSQLVRDIGNLEAGTTAKFTVIRGGKKISDITVKIEERANESDINNSKMWPGFIATPLTDKAREQLKIDDKKVKGVIATNVEEKSPAASLRIQNGDVITAVNGKKVTNLAEFYEELSAAQKSVNFDIYSNGGTITTGTYRF